MKPDCFVWVALLEPEARAPELMQAEFDLHPLAIEGARHGHRRPKLGEQKLITIRHAVVPLLKSTSNLSGTRVPAVCAGMQEYFRDIADHPQRLSQTIESVRDTVSTAISITLSMITLQESETMKRLAAYVALVAVPTLIAGVYGMNFDHMPELRWQSGYPLTLGLMAGIDACLFYRLRKAKWL